MFCRRKNVSIQVDKLQRQICHKCISDNILIPTAKVCDGIVDCPDLSDECLCENSDNLQICADIKQVIIKDQ